jgi:uncharacterized membrane protein YedE/YeeE
MHNTIYLILGTLFGIILAKSEVISWFRIQSMFNFEEAHMYLVIGSAVFTGVVSIKILKALKLKSVTKEDINYSGKIYHHGFIWGSLIFGVGWAITGACPGPVFAQIGSGEYPALITFAGALLGAFAYQAGKSKLPH